MNKIKRNHNESVHMFGVQQLSDTLEQELDIEHPVIEVNAYVLSRVTYNIEIRVQLDGGVEMYFIDNGYSHIVTYEVMDWFIDSELEWSSTKSWYDKDDYPNLVTPSHAERLAGAIEICRLLLDVNFHDEWNFTVSTELKGGNEYSHMPLHEYIHPAYIVGI